TTRDSVDTTLVYEGRTYVLVDTAGIRRKGRVQEPLEKLAVVMALKSLERCQVALVVVDASEGVAAQDAQIAGYGREAGPAAIARRPASLRGDPLTIQSASQVAVGPPTFALRVNRPNDIHFSYERYLVKSLRHAFGLAGSPIRLSLRKATGSRTRARRVRR